ncbi:unnamed protein product [Rhizoctonia solani]|uniref:non-specific serine/threonine protein kinase n=1 Tax=Rhizoctonia solani TaxID=456999 RepID=A0A8H3DZ51_9AGAM|nr:unnamed protein product [Rhizoctonia solani]
MNSLIDIHRIVDTVCMRRDALADLARDTDAPTPSPLSESTIDEDSSNIIKPSMAENHDQLSESTIDEDLNEIVEPSILCTDIVKLLANHGCTDLTASLDDSTCSRYPIANGGLGDVFSGRLRDGSLVAIKTIRTDYDHRHSARAYVKQAAKEIHTWSKCKHHNVVALIGLAVFRDCLAMISYWEENGSLLKYVLNNPSVDRCRLCISICAGLAYLHDNNIIHGDLKGANVLIARDGTAMLMDFGNATLLNATLQFTQTSTTPRMTPRWTAPEILEGKTAHTKAGDVYSLGMTILETFTSEVPFADKSDISLIYHVVIGRNKPKRPENVFPPTSLDGDNLWSTLTKCWTYDPKLRPVVKGVWDKMKLITPNTLKLIRSEVNSEVNSEAKDNANYNAKGEAKGENEGKLMGGKNQWGPS